MKSSYVFRTLTLFSLIFFLSSCEKKNSLSISVDKIRCAATGGPRTFEVRSSGSWQISTPPDFAQCNPMSGNGTTTVTVNFQPNLMHEEFSGKVTITSGELSSVLVLELMRNAENNLPSIPQPLLPLPNQKDVSVFPDFQWEPSTDANGDAITYSLLYSTDQENWTTVFCEDNTQVRFLAPLKGETQYYWKVTAKDNYSLYMVAESPVQTFTTITSNLHYEGEVRTLMENRPTNGVNLVFMCDGFIAEDLIIGGAYDQAAEKALEYFFDVEPYRTYKEYFNAYLVYSHSMERGASYGFENTLKNTSFSLTCTQVNRTSTHMSANNDKILSYASKAPNFSAKETLITVIANDNRYAGTCWMWSNGQAIALTTTSENNYPYNFKGIIQHEAGGHGFGKLADEYIDATTAATRDRSDVPHQHIHGTFANVDVTNDLSSIRWKHFIGLESYKNVGAYEGGYYFSTGVWRPESRSCMINNIDYFNAPSREAIVQRIKYLAREEYSFEEFLDKDDTTMPAFMPPPPTKGQEHLYLHPPIWVQ